MTQPETEQHEQLMTSWFGEEGADGAVQIEGKQSINPCCCRPNQRLQEKKMKLHSHLPKIEPNRGVQLHQDPNQIKEISRLILQEEKAAGDRRK